MVTFTYSIFAALLVFGIACVILGTSMLSGPAFLAAAIVAGIINAGAVSTLIDIGRSVVRVNRRESR